MRLTDRRSNNIKAALEWYRQENSDVHFDVLNCDWDDLFEQIARAQGEHGANGAKKSQWYKYLWRKAGSKAEAVEPWLQLIPDEYGLSLLRGSIAIVFHVRWLMAGLAETVSLTVLRQDG